MIRLKKAALAAALAAVSALSFAYVYSQRALLTGQDRKRPNILIVSLCSFKKNMLAHYGNNGEPIAPHIDQFIAKSTYVFDSMFNGVGWTSLFGYLQNDVRYYELKSRGYTLFGPFEYWPEFVRVPIRQSDAYPDKLWNDNDWEKNHQSMTDYLKSRILSAPQPFYLNVHYKYLHYPLIDRFNKDSGWDQYLTADDRKRLDEYLAHPEKYYNKLPLLMMLTNDPKYAFAHPAIRSEYTDPDEYDRREVMGLLTNARFLKEWQASPGYAQDLELLEKVYKGNVHYLDKVIGPMLELYGDEHLKKNTIVMFTPDHGETHMEDGELTHGNSLSDLALQVPFAIRFPGTEGEPKVIQEQMDFRDISRATKELAYWGLEPDEFLTRLRALNTGVLISRDCQNTRRGLRYKNKYKYTVDVTTGERRLYDLESDPGEARDIASLQPETADQMEELYWKHYPEVTSTGVYKCAPWMQVGSM